MRHLHERVEEHKMSESSVYKNYKTSHRTTPGVLNKNVKVIKKCTIKFDCLLYQMLLILTLYSILNLRPNSLFKSKIS